MSQLNTQIAIRLLSHEDSNRQALKEQAEQLAKALGLVLLRPEDINTQSNHFPFYLEVTDTRLQLRDNTHPKFMPLYVDFLSGKLQHRQRFGGGRGELIAKAIGIKNIKKGEPPLSVLDLTAGLGEDSFILASLGCHVTMVERHPIMACLLRDGLTRLDHPELTLSLISVEASDYLSQLNQTDYPSVIYLDPMFPHRDKSALVKKEMQILQQLVGSDPDANEIFSLALQYAKKRVVVKRPRLAPSLVSHDKPHLKPDLQFVGKSCRFDVYFPIKKSN